MRNPLLAFLFTLPLTISVAHAGAFDGFFENITEVPTYPDIRPGLVGQTVDQLAGKLGAPSKVTGLGSTQFVLYQAGWFCASQPSCRVAGACLLTLNVKDDKVTSVTLDAKLSGLREPATYQSKIDNICNSVFAKKLGA